MAYKINAAARDLFYSRNDPKDRRLGELIGRAAIGRGYGGGRSR